MLALQKLEGLANQPLMDLLDEMNFQMGNICLNDPGLCIGSGSAAKVKIANTTKYLVDGVFCSKSSAEIEFTATDHDITADADEVQEAVYLLTIDANGTVTITMGEIASGSGNALLPERPATGAVLGYVRVAVAAGAVDFDASTDLLSAGHLTDTYVNLGFLGARFDAAQ